MSRPAEDLKKRFERQIVVTPSCWLWSGPTDSHGYGKLSSGRGFIRAHRLSYQIYTGEIGDLHVLHRCDNPRCVNPAHLFVGTHADNMRDKTEKGRAIGAPSGSKHFCAKLTDDQVRSILEDPRPYALISAMHGVSTAAIGDIKTGRTWKSISKGAAVGNRCLKNERSRYLARINELEKEVRVLRGL